MPDPVLYFKAMCAALGASAFCSLALSRWPSADPKRRPHLTPIISLGLGIVLGYLVLSLRTVWPPVNALGRWWLVLFPAVVLIESLAATAISSNALIWGSRCLVAGISTMVLLHDSVYLRDSNAVLSVLIPSTMLLGGWICLVRMSHRAPGVSLPLAVAMAIQSAGIAILLTGYVSGGASAIPIAAALVGTAVTAGLLRTQASLEGPISIGTVSLFSLLYIGNFFGKLPMGYALGIGLAPLLCGISELPWMRNRKRWVVGTSRLVAVAIPLIVVLIFAKLKFDRETLPLL